MKLLKSIQIYLSKNAKCRYLDIGGATFHYFQNLKEINSTFNYLNLFITDRYEEDGKVNDSVLNFYDYYFYFDLLEFRDMPNNDEKKKYFIDKLHQLLLILCDKFNWDKLKFENAYKKCLENNFSCSWYFKNKLFKSPNRNYYFGLFHLINFDGYKVYEILFDNKKNEIYRRVCFFDYSSTFSISWASWENQNEFFYYKFSNISKMFVIKVSDLIENKEYNLPNLMNTSKFFRKEIS
jgi:hypothetical protein